MTSVAIIGSNLIGLICADKLSNNNEVTIFSSELELGFPSDFPGYCLDNQLIKQLLSGQEQSKLFENKVGNSISFRTEWFCKLLTHKLAKNSVVIYNRTRVIGISEFDNQLKINISGSELNQKVLNYDKVIDLSDLDYNKIGNNIHSHNFSSDMIVKPNITTKKYFVGVCLESELGSLSKYDLSVIRSDKLVELWYEYGKEENPIHGWIEFKNVNSYYDNKLMILDDYYSIANIIVDGLVNL